MDREKIQKQARILRNKRLARSAQKHKAIVQSGVVKVTTPLPKVVKNNTAISKTPLTYNQTSRQAASNNESQQQTQRQLQKAAAAKKLQRQKQQNRQKGRGCSGCSRKIGKK